MGTFPFVLYASSGERRADNAAMTSSLPRYGLRDGRWRSITGSLGRRGAEATDRQTQQFRGLEIDDQLERQP